jgi:methionyl-tRNA formyltransferase
VSETPAEPPLPAPPDTPRRLVYFGTPEAAVPPLLALLEAGFDVPLVVSRADRRRGRRAEATPSPVKAAALAAGIEVTTKIDRALEVGADCGIVVAFGRLIPATVLAELPMLNVHFSLLPRWRGAAPVERAMLAGDEVTGVCLMALEPTLDTGPVYRQDIITIGDHETSGELRERLVELGSRQLVEALGAGLGPPELQEGEPVHAAKISRDDLHLAWNAPAAQLHRIVRVGGAWTSFRGKLLKVHAATVTDDQAPVGELGGVSVGCGEGSIVLDVVQPEGKARVDAAAWVNGARLQPGERLGE